MGNSNNYVAIYVPKDLPWYERDGFLTWYDQCKCKDFLNDTDKHFWETTIGNFDIIHKQWSGEKMPKSVLKNYQTLDNDRIAYTTYLINFCLIVKRKFYQRHLGRIKKIFNSRKEQQKKKFKKRRYIS